MKLLDLFCGGGGAGEGYHRAGFDVTGVDINSQPRNPHRFIQGDALEYLEAHGHEYDAISASPPCQRYTNAQKIRGREHPDLIGPLRELLIRVGRPYVIENVPGAPLINPILLCGAMFALWTYRHRLFESNVPIVQPDHPLHRRKTTKMGRPPKEDECMHVVGNFSGIAEARKIMGIPWMTRAELREAIPPVYTHYVGLEILEAIK